MHVHTHHSPTGTRGSVRTAEGQRCPAMSPLSIQIQAGLLASLPLRVVRATLCVCAAGGGAGPQEPLRGGRYRYRAYTGSGGWEGGPLAHWLAHPP
eukprot:scaffold52_cov109-Isochrysis_galbana.AAC.6